MRLLYVELDRFRSRRAVVLVLLTGLLLVTWLAAATIWQTRSPSAADIAGAKQTAAQVADQSARDARQCRRDPASFLGPGATASECSGAVLPSYQEFLNRPTLSLDEERGDSSKAAVLLLASLAVIAGATFSGADWSTGSMGNQLLFRPRRGQVWLAKAAAVTLGATAAAAAVIALLWSAYALTAQARHLGHPTTFVDDLTGDLFRGLVLVAGAALGGFALSMLLRSTVGTLALLFAYSAGGEAIIANVPIEKASQWSLSNNLFAWLDGGTTVFDGTLPCNSLTCNQTYELTTAHGATYLGVLLALAVVTSVLLFRRRDVP